MKTSKWTVLFLALAAALLAAGSAFAHGRVMVGVGFGFGYPGYYPYYYPAYYPYPYYQTPYYQTPVVMQSQPPVYTERQDVAPAHEAGYWYYCAATKGYYPYVKECPGGWQKVAPQPQN